MHLPKDPPQSGLTGCTFQAVCERDPLEASQTVPGRREGWGAGWDPETLF